ncbi:DNA-binding FadR family transcriptional regulator [Saccharopolyspora lacisalsi]|uniref:DNA-binding FadR family transcriptional regulator n=1 Tax=Halosaccharopolyspora lacisalsi TaxID=1000566 RepID=A0A839DX86_9PSEU|nr:GntR family transcriptional regulator [Halosaccharopolyspora lacisalsi]MBA8826114.1 DNA-binding FadR family transcriptional regulator [Halosaccharopolyspora lacisalsi]
MTGSSADAQVSEDAQHAYPLTAPALANIRRLSAVDTVRARISLAVELGLLRPGEWLPTNDKIAQALEVSEITARRALVSLCKDGLLERRRGRGGGTRVVEHPVRTAVRETEAYRSASAEVHRLIDRRLVLECGIAHLAAYHATAEQITHLEELVEQMDHAVSWAEFHGQDERFHHAVAATTGIDTIHEQYGPALDELYRFYLPYPLDHLRESNREHRELLEAIRHGNPLGAADVATRHVTALHRTMFIGLTDE